MAAQKLNSDPIGEDGKAGKFVFLTPVNISSHKFLLICFVKEQFLREFVLFPSN